MRRPTTTSYRPILPAATLLRAFLRFYLSGNVRTKLIVAEAAAKADPELAVNVEALKKVIPKDLTAGEIAVRLGATWIPQED
jgi:N12 class adenine-specific DNA methylase